MKKSDQLFKRAFALMPWGTQTNAKRPYPFFDETMPKFIERGKGCRIWDVDGKEYIDFRLALGPVTLGYCYDEVDDAVHEQMKKGVLFSMASPIETELASLLSGTVPNAGMCRFMKTGEDANMCNVRIARASTQRDMILMSGYHGYPDWFSTAESPQNGVPAVLKEHVKIIPWGDINRAGELIERYKEKIACVITVPYDFNEDVSGTYLKFLREKTREYGIILILDEILTGFRLALGGAQEYYDVDADLASYAKAMANGYPISTYLGKREYMEHLNNFKLTTTYAGETLSIAAAIATIRIMKRDRVQEHLWSMGRRLMDGFTSIVKDLSLDAQPAGLPPASYIRFTTGDPGYNSRIEYLWHRELYREGIFANQRWFISYSHKAADIDEALEKARNALLRAYDAEPVERKNITPFWW